MSELLSDDLRRRHDLRVTTITNGFDPDDLGVSSSAQAAVETGKLTFVHTGGPVAELGAERVFIREFGRTLRAGDRARDSSPQLSHLIRGALIRAVVRPLAASR